MKIDILDGELGEETIEVQGCKIGKGIKRYDSLIALSHFKGHIMAGFGGAIKNIGMGLGSRAGKLDMHSEINPSINDFLCIGCKKCAENCDVRAIEIIEGKAQIDREKCVGCAMCIAVCPQGAVSIPWHGGTSKRLQDKMSEYTKAILSLFNEKVLFINVLQDITKNCDCMGREQEPIIEDIGIIAGDDIVAVEKTSLDLANKYGFENVQKSVDKENQIKSALKLGLGKTNYEIIKI